MTAASNRPLSYLHSPKADRLETTQRSQLRAPNRLAPLVYGWSTQAG